MVLKNWDEIANFCDSKIYHLRAWGDLISQVHGHKLVYLEEEGGIFPLALVKSAIFGSRLISLPFADYGGFCAKDETTARSWWSRPKKLPKNLRWIF